MVDEVRLILSEKNANFIGGNGENTIFSRDFCFCGGFTSNPQDRVYMEQRISDYFVQHLMRDPPPQVRYDYC